jgi:uncharacterized protein involved in type VI secretion and phage assembly
MGVPVVTISSAGKILDSSIELLSLEIHRELNRIPEATLILLDGSLAERRFSVSDLAFFMPGAEITIALRYEQDPSDITVFDGLVVRHAVECSGDHSKLRIELKDQAFVLTRGRHSAVFRDTTDTEVITALIKNAGLTIGRIDTTTTRHGELVQYNSSDWDFLISRAEVLGLGISVHLGEISVRRIALGSPRRQLDHGIDDVSEIFLEIDGSNQWAAVSGIGWDLTNGKATPPESALQPDVSVGNLKASAMAKALGGKEEILLHPAVFQPGELKDWVSARLLRSRFAMLRGRAMVAGDASLEPLDTVEILGVGDRFNGQALVSAVTHSLDENGWQSELRLGLSVEPFASRPDFSDLPAAGLLPPLRGLQIATVGSLETDDQNQFRVQVRLPALPDDQGLLWARLASPDAGDGRGFEFRPEVGDEVVLGFLDDDPRQPVVLGALHSARNPPPSPVENPTESNDLRTLVSRAGTRIVFDDGKPSLTMETTADGKASGSYKNRIAIDESAKTITIEDQHGNAFVLAEEGITLTSKGNITIEASKKVVIKGQSVDIQ